MADRQSNRRSRIAETRDDLSAITSFAHGLAADLALAETDTGMLSIRGDAVILTVPDKSVPPGRGTLAARIWAKR
jgi:hypothetical protein